MKAFVSYPSEKLDAAREVYTFLKAIGVDVWFDEESLVGGEDWARAIKIALRSADLVVLICSAEAVSRSGVIQREIRDALELVREKPFDHIFLVLLRTADIRLPPELMERQYIDFFRSGWQLALARSVKRRVEQLGETPRSELTSYFDACERAGGVEFRAFRRGFAGFEAEADFFTYRTGGEYWDFITAEITSDILGGYYEANAFAVVRDHEMRKANFELGIGMSWFRRIQEYFREGDFVSLQVDAWQFYGGAHGTRGVYTRNYGGPAVGKIELRRLLNYDAVESLRCQCAHGLQQEYGLASEEAQHLGEMLRHQADPWEPFSQWLFNREGVRFWFSMFSGLPYAAGVVDVSLPWTSLKEHVSGDYRDTPFGAFVASR